MKKIRFIFYTFILILILGIGTASAGFYFLKDWGESSLSTNQEVDILIPKGISLKEFSVQLANKGMVSNPFLFEAWVKLFSNYRKFQAGRYLFKKSISPRRIAHQTILGEIYQPTVYSITIPEGYSIPQIANRLAQDKVIDHNKFLQLTTTPSLIKKLNVPANTLEGYLYPATYNFVVAPSAYELIDKMVAHFWKKLPQDYEKNIAQKNLTLDRAVIFASLIEKETGQVREKSAISEVIWRRLNAQVALAIDASIIYGIENYNGNITRKHLRDKNNPYNTRVHKGLPPTAICSPSQSSLEAILTPTDQGYFYYVVENIKTRKHHFSRTLKEHNIYVRKLIRQGG